MIKLKRRKILSLTDRKIKKTIDDDIDSHSNVPQCLIIHKELREYIPQLVKLCNLRSKLFYEHRFLTGTDEVKFAKLILGRNQDFFEGIILSIWHNNPQAVYPLIRALLEDLFLLKYVDKYPDYIKKYMNFPVNTETKLRIFKKECSDQDLKSLYKKLCIVSHPNPDAIRHNLHQVYSKDGKQINGESAILIDGVLYDEFYTDIVKDLIRIYSEEITIIDKIFVQNLKNNIENMIKK